MFQGNCDDGFRVGVKITRKSVKLFAEFYGCDVIIASPLGLRMSIEKEKWVARYLKSLFYLLITYCRNADFLSSIEILVVDQMDALAMQNWEHVQVRYLLSLLSSRLSESFKSTVRLLASQQIPKRVATHRFLADKALVSRRTVRLSPFLLQSKPEYVLGTKLCLPPPINPALRIRDTRNTRIVQYQSAEYCR